MSKYVDAALQVLKGISGGGSISSRELINSIVVMGILEERKYLYHNVLNKIRNSDLFDTSQRGFVSLASVVEVKNNEEIIENLTETEEVFEESNQASSTENLSETGIESAA